MLQPGHTPFVFFLRKHVSEVISVETATTRRICYYGSLLHSTHTTSAPSESARDQANSTDFPCPGTALAWLLCHVTLQIHVILSILSVHPVCPVQSWTEMTRMVFWIHLSGMYQMCFHEASRLEIRWHVQEFKGYSERRAGEPFPHDPVETGDHGQPLTNSLLFTVLQRAWAIPLLSGPFLT